MVKHFKTWEQRVDYSLLLPVFFLIVIGFLSVYVATAVDYPDRLGNVLLLQGLWLSLGVFGAFVVMFFNTKFLWKATPWFYILGLAAMFLPLFFYSPSLYTATGSKNWVTINNITIYQPSEFMKIAYILVLARATVVFQKKRKSKELVEDWKLLGIYALLTFPVLVLLAAQKDLGTALVFIAILSGVVVLSGISWKILLPIIFAIALSIVGFLVLFSFEQGREWLFNLGMDTYQINRISAWLDPFAYATGIAYQQTQSLVSIGSGGLLGKGFKIVELSVPVRESDMIFTVIGENFGFVGSAFVLVCYLWLFYRMLRITLESNNRFYTVIDVGFIMMILFHVFENIGAALGILPLTGIPLPFISQGGSSLISNLIGVGLILSMAYHNKLGK
ncbi:FtsW/RodA/SpoVE family cell cycle protein [Streptococcus sp. S784/96/1]|uniref:FtsW/RodA/SpoVE family cell cycle protein n=1 Tax=Streptococcus sp. S784/96/1 TaxID=2653499 RepID=UPI0013871F27|nr:FtsW/RodA/SpoVE family cell cycle protein [Streptococcus sp. S784/96/1]